MYKKLIYIAVTIFLICIVYILNCSSDKTKLKTIPAIDVSLPENATDGYIFVRGAHILEDTCYVSTKIKTLNFGDKIKILAKHGDWIHASHRLNSDSSNGFIHISQITGNSDAIDIIRNTGLLPRRILYFDVKESTEVSTSLISYDKRLQFNIKDKNIFAIKPLSQPGDAIWIESQSVLQHINDTTFMQLGVMGKVNHLTPKMLYCLTHTLNLKPFGEALAEEMLDSTRAISGIMAFRTAPGICIKPIDATWVLEGKVLAVIDSLKGLMLLEVDPLKGAYQITPSITYLGESPTSLVRFSDRLAVGWHGEKNKIRSYFFSNNMLKDSTFLDIDYKPISLCAYYDNVFVGTEEGNLLWINFDNKAIIYDEKVSSDKIRQVLVYNDGDQEIDDDVYVATDSSGLHIFKLAPSPAAFKKKFTLKQNVNRMLISEEEGVLLSSKKNGLWLLPFDKRKAISQPDFENLAVIDFARNVLPSGSFRLNYNVFESRADKYIALICGDSIRVLSGPSYSKLRSSHSIKIPCNRLIFGVDVLIAISSKDIYFVSNSEIIPPNYSKIFCTIKNEKIRITDLGAELYQGDLIGAFVEKEANKINISQKEHFKNRFVIVQKDDRIIIIGWIFIRNGKFVYLSPGTQVSIGKGGATILGRHYNTGDIVEIGENGDLILVGRWPCSAYIKSLIANPYKIESGT